MLRLGPEVTHNEGINLAEAFNLRRIQMILGARLLFGRNPNVVVDLKSGRRLLASEQHTSDFGTRGTIGKMLI